MNGLTPYEKLKQKDAMLNKHILSFPVMLMETILIKVGLFTKCFINKKVVNIFIPSAMHRML